MDATKKKLVRDIALTAKISNLIFSFFSCLDLSVID